jgi:ABC-type nitrate/sulfonate/bicarbonate transport system substrate-binding protein
MTRPRYHVACVLAVVLASWAPVGAADTVKLGDLPSISNAGIYIALEKGYFQERGVIVETERSPPRAS